MRFNTLSGARQIRMALALLLLPLLAAGCAAAAAGAAAAAAISYSDRGATSSVDVSVMNLATGTERAFRDLGITLTERVTEGDGIELQGSQADWKIIVDIERDAGDPLTDIEVTVSKDLVNYEKSRSEEILRAILQRS